MAEIAVVLVFASMRFVQGQVADLAGEWQVMRPPASGVSSSPFENWIRAIPGAVLSLVPSVIGPLAMVRTNLTYTYDPSRPVINIWFGPPNKQELIGFLQRQSYGRLEGELSNGGCWTHLSLQESEGGSMLSGSAVMNLQLSTRDCRSALLKNYRKKAEPYPYGLKRLK